MYPVICIVRKINWSTPGDSCRVLALMIQQIYVKEMSSRLYDRSVKDTDLSNTFLNRIYIYNRKLT